MVFARMWKDYKEYFQINSYKNTARAELNKAKEYLENWRAQGKIQREIEDINLASGRIRGGKDYEENKISTADN